MSNNEIDFTSIFSQLDDKEKAYIYIFSIVPRLAYSIGIVHAFKEFTATQQKVSLTDVFKDQATAAEIERIKKGLVLKGLIQKDGFICEHYLHSAMLITVENPCFTKFQSCVEKLSRRYPYQFKWSTEEKIRVAIYTQDEAYFRSECQLDEANVLPYVLRTYFKDPTVKPEWLIQHFMSVQEYLLYSHIVDYHIYGEKTAYAKSVIDFFVRFAAENAEVAKTFQFIFLIHEFFSLQLNPITPVEFGQLTVPQDNAAEMNVLLYRVLHAFLLTENRTSLVPMFDVVIKGLTKIYGKKNFALEPWIKYFWALALLETKTNDAFKKVHEITNEPINFVQDEVYLALQNVMNLLQGYRSRIQFSSNLNFDSLFPLDAAMVALCTYWVDTDKITLKKCNALFVKHKDTSILAGKILADIILELDPQNVVCKEYIQQDHYKNVINFTKLLSIGEGWQLALDNLDTFFGGKIPAEDNKEKRLAWVYDIKKREMADILEQSYAKTKWSRGRSITLKRLCEHDKLSYLSIEDQRVIKAIRKEKYWGNQFSYEWDRSKMQMALVGHPVVYNAARPTDLLEIASGKPELVIKQLDENNFHLSLSHFSVEETIITEIEGPNRLRFIHFDQSLLPLSEIIGKNGIKVPTKAKEHIIQIVQKAGLMLPIHSDVADIDIQAQEGDLTPCLLLQPLSNNDYGLEVQLLMRPFGNKGPYFRPGHGRASIQMIENNQPIKAKRNLELEKERAKSLLDYCKILKNEDDGSYEWQLDDPYDCLETLAEIKDYEENHTTEGLAPLRVEWPKGKKINLTEPIGFNKMRLNVKQSRDWFHVDGAIQIDENTVLTLKQVLALLDQSKGRFIQLDDRKYIALTNGLKKQLQELKYFGEEEKAGGFRVHGLGGQALKAFTEQVDNLTVDAEWKKRLKVYADAESFEPKIPTTLQADLREYQHEGFDWMARLAHLGMGACLADDMGLGKTVQALAVLLNHAPKGPCLVVAPTSVCHNWHEEIAKFAPTLTSCAFTLQDRKELVENLGAMDVLICSYTLLQQEAELLAGKKFEMIVLDEAQAIKNATTKRFQAAIQLDGHFKLALSGTPIENSLEELWSLFRFIAPGLLGSRDSFSKRFMSSVEKEEEHARRQALKSLIKAFILRRTKTNVLQELPPKTEQTIHIDMETEEKAFYEAVRQTAIENIAHLEQKPGARKIHILAEITRLRRSCCHPKLVDENVQIPSSKIRVFMKLVEELLQNNHKALVFSQYVGYLDLIRAELDAKNIDYQYLDGSTPAGERQKRVRAFQEGQSSLFLLSLKAGGAGLNLTAADYVIHMDPWWNPAVEDQASDRAHRMGQQRPVTIYRLVMRDSIEERILSLHAEKRELADDLLEGSATAQKLSEVDLINLLEAK